MCASPSFWCVRGTSAQQLVTALMWSMLPARAEKPPLKRGAWMRKGYRRVRGYPYRHSVEKVTILDLGMPENIWPSSLPTLLTVVTLSWAYPAGMSPSLT